MAYPTFVALIMVRDGQKHQLVAQWPPDKMDPTTIAPAEDVAKEVSQAAQLLTAGMVKGILEGFPEAARPTGLVTPGGMPILGKPEQFTKPGGGGSTRRQVEGSVPPSELGPGTETEPPEGGNEMEKEGNVEH
jgi:hypothetical protein